MPILKKSKEDANKEAYSIDASQEAKSFLEKIMGDVSKSSATKQIIIGTTSGWVTGFVTMKIGKVAACAVGGGIIMLQIAAHQGYIKINWEKIMSKAEKITDKVEEKITGEGPNFMDKEIFLLVYNFLVYNFLNIMFLLLFAGRDTMEEELIHCHEFSWRFHYRSVLAERFVDKKLDKAERLLKQGKTYTRRWYHMLTGGDDSFQPTEFHFFLVSYVAGVAIGIATAN
ncbi:FUN14 domain-containing protein 1 [Trachymyrmex septentrionalis]|uniref:FUN14 domain-containing protein 1 n=1 Tax=Trachymyrmex septentrionalis TaxID=34720 RepID=A0A151JVF4_9HYME|nr:FUN14 domain-containing protein 1 [Trachymyrmex septentrionalis]